jgi:NDP-sugar pyrophosphorylase family protein
MATQDLRPRKALLLAAGLGSRMGPISSDLPKPMMPLWGKPLLGHMLDLVESSGVRDVLINLHHNPTPIVEYIAARKPGRVRISFSFEPEIMGTGGALRFADWFFQAPSCRSFWVLNTDIAAVLSLQPILRDFQKNTALAALWLTPASGPRTVEASDGRVSSFRADRPGACGTYTFCGVHLASSRIFSYLPARGPTSIISAYEAAMRAGEQVRGVVVRNSFWADLGTPESYVATHRSVLNQYVKGAPGKQLLDPEFLRRQRTLRRDGVHIDGFAAIAPGATIRPGARLCDSVVWDDAQVGPKALIENALIGRATKVNRPVARVAVACNLAACGPGISEALDLLRWPAVSTIAMPMQARGSDRSFTRLAYGKKSVIVIRYGRERTENARYSAHARFLTRRSVPVPAVILDNTEKRFTVVEDLGTRSLLDELPGLSSRSTERIYQRVIDAALIMHRTTPAQLSRNNVQLEPPFSKALYRWEQNLFASHFLKGMCRLSPSCIAGAISDLRSASDVLASAPKVLIHRDLQSSNIMLRRGHPFFIDFQGMRLGPAAYDLASLLCDPYVMLPVAGQERLIQYCVRVSPRSRTVEAYFWYAAVERLAQALGAFGRLAQGQGTERFAAYIPPALHMMARALAQLDGLSRLKRLITEQLSA